MISKTDKESVGGLKSYSGYIRSLKTSAVIFAVFVIVVLVGESEKATRQQIDAGIEIYKAEYTKLDNQFNKGMPAKCARYGERL